MREKPSFANINLLGECNAECFFCLGHELRRELRGTAHLISEVFTRWANFDKFLEVCENAGIGKIYITGQNVDPLQYPHLRRLVSHLKQLGFTVGVRTNGVNIKENFDVCDECEEVGLSIHSFQRETNSKIGFPSDIDYCAILPRIRNLRVSIVVCAFNEGEILDMLAALAEHNNCRYIQLRKISTIRRNLGRHQAAYHRVAARIAVEFPCKYEYYSAKVYDVFGRDVVLWPTQETTINSYNYFIDGTISKEYEIVRGYLEARK